jgi:phosphoserine phosphatase
MTRLHVFDMDGTLLRSTAAVEISRYLGAPEAAEAVEQGWRRGEISSVEFWVEMLPLWAAMTEDQIDSAFAAAPWMDGVTEVFVDIAARGEYAAVISQSPEFFVRRLESWGAHRTFGSRVAPGIVLAEDLLLTVQDKVDLTMALLDELGLREDDCIAYGDSTSDVALFDRLRHTVGVNPDEALRSRAAVIYEGGDFWTAYALGRELVGAPATENLS